MLTPEEKRNLVIMAQDYYTTGTGKITNAQLNRFREIAKEASCYEEFENFVKYQAGRARGRHEQDFLKGLVKQVEDIRKNHGDKKALEALAHYFGYMFRAARFHKR